MLSSQRSKKVKELKSVKKALYVNLTRQQCLIILPASLLKFDVSFMKEEAMSFLLFIVSLVFLSQWCEYMFNEYVFNGS